MESTTTTKSAIAMTRADLRVWSECPQPATRRLADIAAPVQGTTLPTSRVFSTGTAAVAVPQAGVRGTAVATTFRARTLSFATHNYMDVSPFRSEGPPV